MINKVNTGTYRDLTRYESDRGMVVGFGVCETRGPRIAGSEGVRGGL